MQIILLDNMSKECVCKKIEWHLIFLCLGSLRNRISICLKMEKVWTSCFFRIEDFLGNFLGNAKKSPTPMLWESRKSWREEGKEGERERERKCLD